MFKSRVRGAFDPITMGFVLAFAGTIAVFSFDAKTSSESLDAEVSTVVTDPAN